MRVISGRLGGRHIETPRGKAVRPTMDRVREALFNRLEHHLWDRGGFQGKKILDLFAGTGALGIEALSRGAAMAVFVEREPRVIRTLRENLLRLGLMEMATCIQDDVVCNKGIWKKIVEYGGFDVILADPPYGKRLTSFIVERVREHGILARGGILVIEEGADKAYFKNRRGTAYRSLDQGETAGVQELMEFEPRCYGKTVVRMWEYAHGRQDHRVSRYL